MAATGEDLAPGRHEQGAIGEDWPLRPWLLAGLCGVAGLLIYVVTDEQGLDIKDGWRAAAAAFCFFGSISAALTIERDDWKVPAAFSAVVGLVLAGLAWRAVGFGEILPDEEYGFAAGLVASLLALPLFQAGFLHKRLATSYADAHYHVWSDAISGAGALAFTGLSWLVLVLMSELFHLLRIDLLRDLIDEEWFGWTFSGVAFGAALGTLRNQLKILGTLQGVVMLVFSLLALPLAVALVLFLLAVLVSGLDVLWEATRSATPMLLAFAAGAFVLTNAIVRDDDASASANRALRIAALVLALGIFPLAALAAISMGVRIGAYGFSPERLWGMTAILVACLYGLVYWLAVARGRKPAWREQLRRANFYMALAMCAIALFLALPILDFGGISTRNQLARLESGAVSAEDFDYAALKWDFGSTGQEALEQLAHGSDAKVAELAQEALDSTSRPWRGMEPAVPASERLAKTDIRVEDEVLRAAVERFIRAEPWRCGEGCTVLDLGAGAQDGGPHLAIVQGVNVEHLRRDQGGALVVFYPGTPEIPPRGAGEQVKGTVEVRPFTGRQVYVDGKPAGQPFE